MIKPFLLTTTLNDQKGMCTYLKENKTKLKYDTFSVIFKLDVFMSQIVKA